MLGDSSRAIHLRGLNCVGELFGGEKAVLSTGQVNDMSVSFGWPELEGWNHQVESMRMYCIGGLSGTDDVQHVTAQCLYGERGDAHI